ncbi:glycosyltransferase family 39 protein [Polyangium aurulentum]|uniref:glycosyltransferase family 39 protein n=1 Tax=Polyangium aurulentum TaxID=2567896 RepID=UPI0010AE8D83|nr:glycosyltransferase family 39 protein [Polyangium aurulentum]UQA59091.1 glycosyltransferase family 39 protein [Polyangium aurulentum]
MIPPPATSPRARALAEGYRALLAALLLLAAALLVRPAPAPPATVTWETLLAPLAPGLPVVRGYVLSPPRRGEEHDVVLTARREGSPAGRIELHIVDRGRWRGIRETKSFGVAYEEPRSHAPAEDLEAVTEALTQALAKNDAGLPSVDAIPLAAEPPPPFLARALGRVEGPRGALIAALVATGIALLASLRRGALLAAIALLALGLALRLPHLDVPFVRDQDVQRLFTGALPLGEILTGKGLLDRHPPLWFVVLHAVLPLGPSEAVARLPAAIAGALVGPAIVAAAWSVRGRAGPVAALAGLAVTLSPALVARSREVSEIPLFSLLSIAICALVLRASEAPSRRTRVALAASVALALWTYYLGPLVLLGAALPLLALRRLGRDAIAGLAWGTALGAPALVLGARTMLRDHGARTTAARFPELAWGERTPGATLVELAREATVALGPALLAFALVGAVFALVRRRDPAPLVPAAAALATALGIALVSPFARVQPYYLTAVAPLFPLAIALLPAPSAPRAEALTAAACAAAIALLAVGEMPGARLAYLPDADAFMPRFAAALVARPERRIAVVAHYDATLLAYYLARASGTPVGWPQVDTSGDFAIEGSSFRILPLARAHHLDANAGEAALQILRDAMREGPIAVIERDAMLLAPVHEELSRCEGVLEAPSARLVVCGGGGPR